MCCSGPALTGEVVVVKMLRGRKLSGRRSAFRIQSYSSQLTPSHTLKINNQLILVLWLVYNRAPKSELDELNLRQR
jgi:hypothetical protein